MALLVLRASIITSAEDVTSHLTSKPFMTTIFFDNIENVALYYLNRFYVTTWKRVFDRCHGNCRRQDRLSLPPTSRWPQATLPLFQFIKDQNIPFILCMASGMFSFLFWEGGNITYRILKILQSLINMSATELILQTCSSKPRERYGWNQVEYYWNTASRKDCFKPGPTASQTGNSVEYKTSSTQPRSQTVCRHVMFI